MTCEESTALQTRALTHRLTGANRAPIIHKAGAVLLEET